MAFFKFSLLLLLILKLCTDAAVAAGAPDDATTAEAADNAAVAETVAAEAAEAALQYLHGAGIRTRDSATATADRCASMSYTHPLTFNVEGSNNATTDHGLSQYMTNGSTTLLILESLV